MASSSSIPTTDERDRKRKRGGDEPETDDTQQAPSKWRTRREHEMYSTKLLDALRLVRAGGGGFPSPSGAREVRDAANRALAVAARGRSRWSRAVLLLASRSRARAHQRVRVRAQVPAQQPRRPSTAGSSPSGSAYSRSPALARKAQELGRLVPGCRKLPFPALLSETSDYIAALQMQVRAMAALAQALSAIAPSSPSPS